MVGATLNDKDCGKQAIYVKTEAGFQGVSPPLALAVGTKFNLNVSFDSGNNMIVDIKDSTGKKVQINAGVPIKEAGDKCYFKSGLYLQINGKKYPDAKAQIRVYQQQLSLP